MEKVAFLCLTCDRVASRKRVYTFPHHQYRLDDPELSPYAAMLQVDREQVCLTEIDPDSEVEVVDASYEGEEVDVVLHVRSDWVSRSVAFAWEDGEYVWIGEAETHYSGRTYVNFEGTEEREMIFVSYHERARSLGTGGADNLLFRGKRHPTHIVL